MTKSTKIELTDEDAMLFMKFQQYYDVIGYLIGFMESTGMYNIKNSSITIDIDKDGIVQHTSITRHFRK